MTSEASPASTPIGPLGLRVGQRARRTHTVTERDVELYAPSARHDQEPGRHHRARRRLLDLHATAGAAGLTPGPDVARPDGRQSYTVSP